LFSFSGDFEYLIKDLVRIIELLEKNGTTAVTWYDLKYYVQRFLTPPNIAKLALYYFRNSPQNAKTYYNDIYLGDIKTPGCKKALSLWLDAMASPLQNTWAIRMFDASGKPPANLLAANTNWLGDWTSCHKVNYTNTTFQFQGRYCRAKIRADPSLLALAGDNLEKFPGDPTVLAAIDIGLCVPDFCINEDVASLVNNTLRLLTIHQITNVHYLDGVQCEAPVKPTAAYYFTIVLITILTSIVVLATLYDCFFRAVLNKPYATASTLSMQNLHTIFNFSSAREQPHGILYKNLDAYQYQFSNRLQLHGMSYPSEATRTDVSKRRKSWYNQTVYKVHRIAIELSAYTTILKPMTSSGKNFIKSILKLIHRFRCNEMFKWYSCYFNGMDRMGSYL
jgi:hypothetical protein